MALIKGVVKSCGDEKGKNDSKLSAMSSLLYSTRLQAKKKEEMREIPVFY